MRPRFAVQYREVGEGPSVLAAEPQPRADTIMDAFRLIKNNMQGKLTPAIFRTTIFSNISACTNSSSPVQLFVQSRTRPEWREQNLH